MLKRNSFPFGMLLGVVVTVGSYFLIRFLNVLVAGWIGIPPVFSDRTIQLLSIVANVLPFRYYMLKAQMDYTGRGILMITFITGLTFFFYYLKD